MLVGDPAASEEPAEVLGHQEVAPDLILEVLLPVESDRPRDVRLAVQIRVLVHLGDADRVVVQMLLEPLRLDQDVLRILGHGSTPSPDKP